VFTVEKTATVKQSIMSVITSTIEQALLVYHIIVVKREYNFRMPKMCRAIG